MLSLTKGYVPLPREAGYTRLNLSRGPALSPAVRGLFFGGAFLDGTFGAMPQSFSANFDPAVRFGDRLIASDQFHALFKDGMDLVGAAAAYLDGEGRRQAQALPRPAALAYAVESMRLTTRLMQIASWLLLQRAVNEGELTRAEAASDKRRIRLSRQDAAAEEGALRDLPRDLCELVEASLRVQARIRRLDVMLHEDARPAGVAELRGPVASQLAALEAAFRPAGR